MKVHVNPTIDVGFNPILPDEGLVDISSGTWEFFLGAAQDFGVGLVKMTVTRIAVYVAERFFLSDLPDWGIAAISIGFFLLSLFLLGLDWNSKYALLGGAFSALMVMIGVATKRLAVFTESMVAYVLRNPALAALMTVIREFANKLLSMVQNFIRKLVDVMEVIFNAILIVIAVGRAMQL